MARLQGDTELYERLMWAQFEGRGWSKFVDVLVEYGYAVLVAWIATDSIRVEVARKSKIRLAAPPQPLTQEDAEDLASMTVAASLEPFRTRVLGKGIWDPRKGAALSTFWIGFCLLRYPDIYRPWLTEQRHWHDPIERARADASDPSRTSDNRPERRFETDQDVRDALATVPVLATRLILMLQAAGYDHAAIAELLGLSKKSIESRINRHRKVTRTCLMNPSMPSLLAAPSAHEGRDHCAVTPINRPFNESGNRPVSEAKRGASP